MFFVEFPTRIKGSVMQLSSTHIGLFQSSLVQLHGWSFLLMELIVFSCLFSVGAQAYIYNSFFNFVCFDSSLLLFSPLLWLFGAGGTVTAYSCLPII